MKSLPGNHADRLSEPGRRKGIRSLRAFLAAAFLCSGAIAAEVHLPPQGVRECDECPRVVLIPAGSFMMGADKQFEEAEANEAPRHRVTIVTAFALGQYEVTQAEWTAVMGSNPSVFKGRERPVDNVSWNDVQQYLKKLNAKSGLNYRLPTEAEWEYAARAGSEEAYAFDGGPRQAPRHAWFDENSGDETHPVGQLTPNRFGLYDLFGNVWEWVEDCWHDSYRGAPADGSAWIAGQCHRRVQRGGSFYNRSSFLRSANRNYEDAAYRFNRFGFRVARSLDTRSQ
jgi:formylglycine-generating enzyme required for sulfatase activity